MGIVHFAPVGLFPGAVTSALAYFKHNPDVREDYPGAIVQDVIVFCSHEVAQGEKRAGEVEWNDYGRTSIRRDLKLPGSSPNVLEVIRLFLERETLLEAKGHLYVWPVNVQDFDQCFEAVAKVAIVLGGVGQTGRYIWANLTGGTNILNAAILQTTFLSGLIGRLYYTFLGHSDYQKYLQPPSNVPDQYALRWIPTAKTTFDPAYYCLLKLLKTDEWLSDETLLNQLKQDDKDWRYFERMELQAFRQEFLNKMDGHEIEREMRDSQKLHRVRLSMHGQKALERLSTPLFQGLVKRGQEIEPSFLEEWRKELDDKRIL